MNDYIGFGIFALALFWVSYRWCKKSNSWIQSVLLSVWLCMVCWLNVPNFLSVLPETELKSGFFSWPLRWYQQMGLWYIIISNGLLAGMGEIVGRQWGQNRKYRQKEVKDRFDSFSADATELKVVGRNLVFLREESYKKQREVLEKLGNKAKLLCAASDKKEQIELYHDLMEKGIQIRAYSSREGIANLKGQIKTDIHKQMAGIFTFKCPPEQRKQKDSFFDLTELSDGYLVDAVSQQFDRTFDNARNPLIRCIAFDLGGVYLDGDLDDFYEYIESEFHIKIPAKKRDRLNIDDRLMKGEIVIRQYLKEVSDKTKQLGEDDWEKIQEKWQKTWRPNVKMRELMDGLAENGYKIIAFSNLDKENGDKYQRENYLPSHCTEHWFSYEKKACKPDENAFRDFFSFAKSCAKISFHYQILLIDDQSENISVASKLGWSTICYSNNQPIEELQEKLRRMGIQSGNV